MLMMSLLLVLIVMLLFLFMSYKKKYDFESSSSYECGFTLKSETRMVFSYRFFLVSVLFLVFDVEIVLMLPIPFMMMSMKSVWNFMMFIIILIIGLLYEYKCGSLDWL